MKKSWLTYLDESSKGGALDVVDLCGQDDAGAGAELAVGLGDSAPQHQDLKVDVAERHRQQVQTALHQDDSTHLTLQANRVGGMRASLDKW